MNKASHYRKGPLKNRTFGNDNKGKAHAKAEVKPNVNQTNRTGAVDPNNTFWDGKRSSFLYSTHA